MSSSAQGLNVGCTRVKAGKLGRDQVWGAPESFLNLDSNLMVTSTKEAVMQGGLLVRNGVFRDMSPGCFGGQTEGS